MFYDSLQFKAMESGLNALSIQQKMILHNLANYETPGYKAKSVSFEDVLGAAERKNGEGRYDFKAKITTDDSTSVRPDGNNVNADVESLKLYQNYAQQLYLYQKISGQFSNFRYVLSQSAK